MQLTDAQKALALQELLEMLAAHPEGLRTGALMETKSFCRRRELTAKQVEQLLRSVDGVREEHVENYIDKELGMAWSMRPVSLWKLEKANG